MGDKKLNEVTKVTDMAYVPVIMSDGSIGQIAKADLASVVAGLIGYKSSEHFIPRSGLGSGNNLNDYTTDAGIYRISGQPSNSPIGYGFLFVYKHEWSTVQICIASNATSVYIRIYWNNSWTDWFVK